MTRKRDVLRSCRVTQLLRACLVNEDAQAYVEYVIVFLFLALSVIGTMKIFAAALCVYLKRIFYIVSLPLP